ncbi:MAG: OmpA family protein [Bacteroidia bacterium]|nr:OmpA family protein [Bacteroidia bacterium]
MFKAKKGADGKYKVENLQYPLNTSADDFGIIFEGNSERGFFTSNRSGGKGQSDIYYFEIPGLQLTAQGFVKDEKTGTPVIGALVKILGDDGYTLEMNTEADGSYKFKLRENVDYSISASYKDYFTNKGLVSTKGVNQNQLFKQDITLSKIVKNVGITLPNIEYAFNDTTLRPESMVELDKLVETLNDNPTITIELGANTDFRGKDDYNMKLSFGRARSVVTYLISKGIEAERLTWKGYGKSQPKVVTDTLVKAHPFLKTGDVLTEAFITALKDDNQKEECNQINRRTEFKVLSTDFISKIKSASDEEQPDQQNTDQKPPQNAPDQNNIQNPTPQDQVPQQQPPAKSKPQQQQGTTKPNQGRVK